MKTKRNNSPTAPAALTDTTTLTTTQKFERFHQENPHVYQTLAHNARTYKKQTGKTTCGIQMLIERARWVLNVETTEKDPGINNNYAAYYARLLNQEPDLTGMFPTRKSNADQWTPTTTTTP